ncbi:MAG: hypothetical protein EA369_01620 [Bradymonadales bacterium]|nr:MAG: hypothetical protein EA369_01620 [Bradymonadales bacterium]
MGKGTSRGFHILGLSLLTLLGGCADSTDQPQFFLPQNPGLFNVVGVEQATLSLKMIIVAEDDLSPNWEGFFYAELENPQHPQLGRLSERAAYGSDLELVIGSNRFPLKLNASATRYQMPPVLTAADLLTNFGFSSRHSHQPVSHSVFRQLFQEKIQLRSLESGEDLIVTDSSPLRTPASVFKISEQIVNPRFIWNCETDEIQWNGSSGGRLQMIFVDDHFGNRSLQTRIYELPDVGASRVPLESSPNLFEELFPGSNPSLQSENWWFDRVTTRTITPTKRALKHSQQMLQFQIFSEEVSLYEIRYSDCSSL